MATSMSGEGAYRLAKDGFQLRDRSLSRITQVYLVMMSGLNEPLGGQEVLVQFLEDRAFVIVSADMQGLHDLSFVQMGDAQLRQCQQLLPPSPSQ